MKTLLAVVVVAVALPLFADSSLFAEYESVRQGFLKSSLAKVQKNAASLATKAEAEKNDVIATHAQAVAKSANLAKAREHFALLSQEMIKVRNAATGARPAVYSCPMVKKAWLQPKGTVGNPYDSSMLLCGTLTAE